MMKWLFILLVGVTVTFLFLRGRLNNRSDELPVFLCTDKIAGAHRTNIQVIVQSLYRPESQQLETLKNDYSNIWAHLNYLYATNDVEAGKEYYTEDWFKQIARHYEGVVKPQLQRYDEAHHLLIKNWSDDGLVCTAVDSNLVFKTVYPNGTTRRSAAQVAIVLLFQGDHWRIDALRIIQETPL